MGQGARGVHSLPLPLPLAPPSVASSPLLPDVLCINAYQAHVSMHSWRESQTRQCTSGMHAVCFCSLALRHVACVFLCQPDVARFCHALICFNSNASQLVVPMPAPQVTCGVFCIHCTEPGSHDMVSGCLLHPCGLSLPLPC